MLNEKKKKRVWAKLKEKRTCAYTKNPYKHKPLSSSSSSSSSCIPNKALTFYIFSNYMTWRVWTFKSSKANKQTRRQSSGLLVFMFFRGYILSYIHISNAYNNIASLLFLWSLLPLRLYPKNSLFPSSLLYKRYSITANEVTL